MELEQEESFICVGQILRENLQEYDMIMKTALVGCKFRDLGRKEYLSTRLIKE